jgi:anti-anti-sigma factor
VAVGRRPDLESLSLEKAGVAFTARGIVTDRKLRTSTPHIYACGDIAGPFQLATTAETQAIVAATNAFIPLKRAVNYRNNIFVVFTEPPLAWVGLTEADARKRYGRKLRVYRFPYTGMRRAMIDGTETGMAKILCDSRGRIAGAHILGESAGEVIHELQLLRAFRQPLHRLQNITHAYPTYAQAIAGRAGQLAFLDRMKDNFFVNLALRLMPGFANRLQHARDRLAETHPMDAFTDLADSVVTKTAAPTNVRDFSIEIRRSGEDAVILDIRGALTASSKEAFVKTFGEAIQTAKRVLMNLSGLLGLDIQGVGLLVVEVTKARRRQIDIMACGLSGPLRDVLRISGLDETITLYEDEEDALCCRRFLEKSGLQWISETNESNVPLPGWARSLDRLTLAAMPPSAMNINVEGRRLAGPVQGFGRLWEKRYRLHLAQTDLAPREIIAIWRAEFPDFWPEGNFLFPSANAPIAPGTTALLNLSMPGGLVLATGLMIIHADDTSFSFITAEGHILSGWITFSSAKLGDSTYIEVHPLFRSADPLMEMGFRLGAALQEDRFWHESLTRFALRLGTHGDVAQRDVLHDDRVQWKRMANLRFSAAWRSAVYMPVYLLKKWFSPKKIPKEKAP